MGTVARYRLMVVLLTAALLATLTVALTGGDRADAIDGPVDVVYVATGRNFPDALAGSTLAGALGAPLLTVEPNPPLPQATIDALVALDPDRIIVFGGPGAVSDDVLELLTAHARSGSVTRIAGDNRHDTAQAIADALPDKVHDSDLLDGLDSTDFLRTTDAAADSQALGGLSLAEVRQFSATPTFMGGGASPVPLGVMLSELPDDETPYVDWRFSLPPEPVEPVRARVVMSVSGPCTAALQTSGLAQPVGSDSVFDLLAWVPAGEEAGSPFALHTFTFPASVETHAFDLTLEPSPSLAPGDPIALRILRSPDDVEDDCGDVTISTVTILVGWQCDVRTSAPCADGLD